MSTMQRCHQNHGYLKLTQFGIKHRKITEFILATVFRQRLTHFVYAQNLKMCQSLACQFSTDFADIFGPKIGIFDFREPFRKDIFTR